MEEAAENLQADLAANDAPELLAEEVPQKERIRAAPSIFKIAEKFGIDLSKIKGSGTLGFITKADIEHLMFKRSIQIVTHRHCQRQLFAQVEHKPEGMAIVIIDPICIWCRRAVAGETDFVGDRRDYPELAAIIQTQMVAEESAIESLKDGGED